MDHIDHDHIHEHTHTHGGEEHTHAHSHCHCHEHGHDHGALHAENGAVSPQTVAVLKYMLDHNIHHAAELNDLAGQISGEAQHQLQHAVEAFDQANGYLSAALELLK